MPTVIDQKTTSSYLALLELAHREGLALSRTKLAKLLYFADLEAVIDREERPTSIEWKWLEYGPFENALYLLEGDLREQGWVAHQTVQYPSYTGHEFSIQRFDYARPTDVIWANLACQVERYGRLAAVSVKDLAYQTPPMLAAQRGGERGVVLDLELARPNQSKVTGAVARLKAVRDALDAGEDAPGSQDALVDDLSAFSDARTAVNKYLLDV